MDRIDNSKQIADLTKVVARLSKPATISEALSDMKIVTTAGILRSALRAYVTAGTRKYNSAPENHRRGSQPGGEGNNAYPKELKDRVLAEFDDVNSLEDITVYSHNYAAIARKYGINRVTVKRWVKAHFAPSKGK